MISDNDVIELWAEANKLAGIKHPHTFDELKEFAQLVAEKIREKTLSSDTRQWVKMSQMLIANEREACAKICDELDVVGVFINGEPSPAWACDCAHAIRARSNT